jgi:ADP-ribose pyrophosphatase
MCDPDEKVSQTLKREFMEEALNSLRMTDTEKLNLETRLKSFFDDGREIYHGYVDDPRNTGFY